MTLEVHRTLWPQLVEPVRRRPACDLRDARDAGVPALLARIERNGVCIDAARCWRRRAASWPRAWSSWRRRRYEIAGQPFNLGSPKQLGEILFGKLGLPVKKKTATGAPSAPTRRCWQELAEPTIRCRQGAAGVPRAGQAASSTYTDKLPQHGQSRHRPGPHQLCAGGGGDRPPGQQRAQPAEHPGPHARGPAGARGLRGAAGPCAGQRRLLADRAAHHGPPGPGRSGAAAGLPPMAWTCTAPRPRRSSASPLAEVTPEQRRYAKTINFGLIYGMSAFGLAQAASASSRKAAQRLYRPLLRPLSRRAPLHGARPARRRPSSGYVETLFGRRLHLVGDPWRQRASALRKAPSAQAINAPMQGTASDIMKRAMVAVEDWLIDTQGRATRVDHPGARRTGAGGARGPSWTGCAPRCLRAWPEWPRS